VSNGSEPNLSSRGGNPSLAASSGFELDESDEVDVQPLPFRWIPVLFRPGGVEAVAAVNFGVESWEEKKGQCGSAGPERKGRRDSGGRRSWEKRRELVREKNASSAHRERGGGGGKKNGGNNAENAPSGFGRESLPIKVLQVPVLRIVPVLVEGVLAVCRVPLAVETCARSGKVSKRKTTRSGGENNRRTVVVPPVGREACPPGCEDVNPRVAGLEES
jgi:hypothetical protein